MSETKIVWHPVKLVPYDPERHDALFIFAEEDEKPDLVWEGYLPPEDGSYLVTCELNNGDRYVEFADYDSDNYDFVDSTDVIAWAELPEPYKPEE